MQAAEKDVVPFSYAPRAGDTGSAAALVFPEFDSEGDSAATHSVPSMDATAMRAEFERRLEEEKSRSFAEGLACGIEDGRTAEREARKDAQAEEAEARAAELERIVQQFAAERDQYLERVEAEVVRLALAIAGRVLRREAQTDPLLLLGSVRVALGQLSGATRLRLRVPAAHAALWTEAVALLPDRGARPEVVADEALSLGDCVLESELGSVDLAVPAQLGEIDRRLLSGAAGAGAGAAVELEQ